MKCKMKNVVHLAVLIAAVIPIGFATAFEDCEQGGECDVQHRSRRSAPSARKTCDEGSKTPLQAQTILNSYIGTFQTNLYNDIQMKNKTDYRKETRNLIPAMCRNTSIGRSSWAASTNLSTWIYVQRTSCNDTNNALSDIPCQNCSNIARFRITKDPLLNNSQWNCTQGSNNDSNICEGLCIGSVRMREDMISNYSSRCLSHIVDIHMFNPSTNKPLLLDTSKTVVELQLQFDKGNRQFLDSNFKCASWLKDTKDWTTSHCSLELIHHHPDNKTLAKCNCTTFGPVCIVPTQFNGSYIWPSPSSQTNNQPGATGNIQPGNTQNVQPGNTQNVQPGNTENVTPGSTPTIQSSGTTTIQSASIQPSNASSQLQATSSLTTSNSTNGNNGNTAVLHGTLTFPGDCKSILEKEEEIKTKCKELLKSALSIQEHQIDKIIVKCGSIIVEFTLKALNSSNLDTTTNLFNSFVSSNQFVINLSDGTKLAASKSGMGITAGNFTILTAGPPTVGPTTRERFKLEFDYRPIMFTIAFVTLAVVLCVCGSCIIHTYWLKKAKFTKYNSMTAKEYERKMKAKEEKDRMKEVEEVQMTALGTSRKVSPTNFDMSNEKMPKMNERSFTNYDWAQTSFIPPPSAVPDLEGPDVPKLMLDDSDSSDGEENKGFEYDEGQAMPRTLSHLSLEKDNTTDSDIAPPVYENIDDEHLYDTIKER